jgi:hypothetical protein
LCANHRSYHTAHDPRLHSAPKPGALLVASVGQVVPAVAVGVFQCLVVNVALLVTIPFPRFA